MKSVPAQIMRRVLTDEGGVFTPSDFLDLGDRAAIDQALSRLARKGSIRRLTRGLYGYPRISPLLGQISPSPDLVAQALARKTRSALQVSGAQAANALGLSTQVPAHAAYLTDGPSRQVMIGKTVVDLRHASPKYLIAAGTVAGAVIQALRYLGKDAGAQIADTLDTLLSASDRRRLIGGLALAPRWMQPVLYRLAHGIELPPGTPICGVGNNPTQCEALLLAVLRSIQAGWVLHHHVPGLVGAIDLTLPTIRLAVEVDGPGHSRPQQRARDARKEAFLRSLDWTVLRFTNAQVLNDLSGCVTAIAVAVATLSLKQA